MEGRAHPDAGDEPSGNDEPPLLSSSPPPSSCNSARRSHETYVIQIPKDQVYRVPPPENARIAELFRNPPEMKRKKPRLRRPMTVAIAAVVMCLVVGVTGLIMYLLLRPQGPSFSVSKVSVVNTGNSKPSAKKHPPEYDISLEAINPNKRLGINYLTNENVTLFFGGKNIAVGKFPELYQEKDGAATVRLVLVGTTAALPLELEKKVKGAKSKIEEGEGVDLSLEMNVNMKMDLGFTNTWRMESKASCFFKVSSLDAGSKVISQQCQCSSL